MTMSTGSFKESFHEADPCNNDRPFYKATTALSTLALVDPLIEGEGGEGGSSLQWWTRGDSNPRPPRCERCKFKPKTWYCNHLGFAEGP